MKHASVVIIGGGIMGASAAYHLAARGWKDVLVLDRAPRPGLGSTGRATGGFRAQFSTAVNVKLSLLAREKLMRFGDEIGVDAGYMQAGYLWLAGSERERGLLRDALAVQHAAGATETYEASLDEVATINPAANLEGIVAGFFGPRDGFISPLAILTGYTAAAERIGVRFEWNAEVVKIEHKDERITHVATKHHRFATDSVVDAAGPWAGDIAKLAGANLPVTPLRRQVGATVPQTVLPPKMPMTIWVRDQFHLRVRDGRALLLYPTPGIPGHPYDATLDTYWLDEVGAIARERLPVLQAVEIDPEASWGGLYEMTPDRHSVLGAAPERGNLFYIAGSSGHGVMHSTALGQLLAEIMSDGHATSVDVSALSPARFAAGVTAQAADVL
ncbi:MAG TPA: FAD-dependent oxidoreductase [Candidatus Eisenbacteria bacterium]|nr:FAD-dependent oxidoreductase [Candidatus Eisenbacteria bacterium]